MDDHLHVDTIGIVELLSPPRRRVTRGDLDRWIGVVNDQLADIRDHAQRGKATLHYFGEPTRRAYASLGTVAGLPVSLVIQGEGRLRVALFLQVGSDAKLRDLPIFSRQTRDLANDLLNLAERQHELRQQLVG